MQSRFQSRENPGAENLENEMKTREKKYKKRRRTQAEAGAEAVRS